MSSTPRGGGAVLDLPSTVPGSALAARWRYGCRAWLSPPAVYAPVKGSGYLVFRSIAGLHFFLKYKPEVKKQLK